ncbi:hypothetical protein [Streptomyces caatingaensis]|uniref:FXSXX-COOH protein n=1 Tax=Streptomyces caatingaensis TaxID=1678637 RepID=A0A0K9XFC1_9ACTN|nr:hypothetical protein [Streptomyces caatingaensis]KNB51933.1 hypothetical protein AC230_16715 [Streptomyces caatingaensis]
MPIGFPAKGTSPAATEDRRREDRETGGGGTEPLPDLTGVGLGRLRTLDDPRVTAAVDAALRDPAELAETWYSSGAQGGRHRPPGGNRT